MKKIILGLVIFSCGVLSSVATLTSFSHLELKEHTQIQPSLPALALPAIPIPNIPTLYSGTYYRVVLNDAGYNSTCLSYQASADDYYVPTPAICVDSSIPKAQLQWIFVPNPNNASTFLIFNRALGAAAFRPLVLSPSLPYLRIFNDSQSNNAYRDDGILRNNAVWIINDLTGGWYSIALASSPNGDPITLCPLGLRCIGAQPLKFMLAQANPVIIQAGLNTFAYNLPSKRDLAACRQASSRIVGQYSYTNSPDASTTALINMTIPNDGTATWQLSPDNLGLTIPTIIQTSLPPFGENSVVIGDIAMPQGLSGGNWAADVVESNLVAKNVTAGAGCRVVTIVASTMEFCPISYTATLAVVGLTVGRIGSEDGGEVVNILLAPDMVLQPLVETGFNLDTVVLATSPYGVGAVEGQVQGGITGDYGLQVNTIETSC